MIMKIKYLKAEALDSFRANLDFIFDYMLNNSDKEWMTKVLGDTCFADSKVEYEPFKWDTSFASPIDSDCNNAIILHQNLKSITRAMATDERLWSGMALTIGYDYLLYRWPLDKITKLQYRWVFYTPGRRKLYYQGIARLWWYAELTFDKNADDPYRLTRFVYKYPHIMEKMIYRNYSMNEKVRFNILYALLELEKKGIPITYNAMAKTYREISKLGSVMLIDEISSLMTREKVTEVLSTFN
jgi:hypothetical protein